MALENFLWEFGENEDSWLKPKKGRNQNIDGTINESDVDMLNNIQVNCFFQYIVRPTS